jgi:chromosome segregation ATPase
MQSLISFILPLTPSFYATVAVIFATVLGALWKWSSSIERAVGELKGAVKEIATGVSELRSDIRMIRDNHLVHLQADVTAVRDEQQRLEQEGHSR